jgi:hypothetical protein
VKKEGKRKVWWRREGRRARQRERKRGGTNWEKERNKWDRKKVWKRREEERKGVE